MLKKQWWQSFEYKQDNDGYRPYKRLMRIEECLTDMKEEKSSTFLSLLYVSKYQWGV
jgi:hypothetical protein